MQRLVSLSAYPKSGVTYLSFLLFHSLFPGRDIHDIERKYIIDIHAYPNAGFAEPDGPRLIKSHLPYVPDLPVIEATEKAIYLIRNPIDVMMSAWDFQNLTAATTRSANSPEFRAYVRAYLQSGGAAFPFGSWLQHVRSWLAQTRTPVKLVRYDSLVEQPDRELEGILDFLALRVSPEQIRTAVERSSMRAMGEVEEEEIANGTEGVFFSSRVAAGYNLGHRFINKGYRNSYETVLTQDERALADSVFGAEFKRFFSGPA